MVVIDLLGFLLGVTGAILVGQKNYWGFFAFMLHSFCYGLIAIADGRTGLLATCTVFFLIDLYYFKEWRRDNYTSN